MASVPGLLANCYRTSEALYHALGGKAAGLTPMQIVHEGRSHWYLRWVVDGEHGPETYYLDATAGQFDTVPPYHEGRGCGFQTKQPSKKAAPLLAQLPHRPECVALGCRGPCPTACPACGRECCTPGTCCYGVGCP